MRILSIVLPLTFLLAHFPLYAQNVGIGNTSPMAQLSVGTTSQFRVNSTGNLIRINNLPYSFPTVQGTNQYLRNDGAGNLTWSAAPKPAARVFTVINSGASSWLIDQTSDYVSGNNVNPTLVLVRGLTYHFAVTGGHPFVISNAPMSGSFLVGVGNNGEDNGTVTFTVPMDAPSTLYYYCSLHPATMHGTFTIL